MRKLLYGCLIAVALSGCSDKDDTVADASSDAGDEGGSGGRSGSGGSGTAGQGGSGAGGSDVPDGGPVIGDPDASIDSDAGTFPSSDLCGGPCACADGIDNDGDGLTDGFDAECTGATDNDEGTFATGIPGDNRDPKWQDCFFDGNSGAGDDHCRYSTDCLLGDADADDPDCQVRQECIDFCAPLTPNGCDCFGCCTFRLEDGSDKSVVLQESCSQETLEDCAECVPATNDCSNECGRCELCPGKTVEDLPDDCGAPPTSGSGGSGGTGGSAGTSGSGGTGGEDPPPYTCDNGTVCADSSACPANYYCSLGCCLVILE